MGFLKNIRRSVGKSRLIKDATANFKQGYTGEAIDQIYDYLSKDETFFQVLEYFQASRKDLETIIWEFMASGAGGTYKGHFVPVSAVLFPDTLAYLLRAERGQVNKTEAFFQIQEYFRSGGIHFEPERQFYR